MCLICQPERLFIYFNLTLLNFYLAWYPNNRIQGCVDTNHRHRVFQCQPTHLVPTSTTVCLSLTTQMSVSSSGMLMSLASLNTIFSKFSFSRLGKLPISMLSRLWNSCSMSTWFSRSATLLSISSCSCAMFSTNWSTLASFSFTRFTSSGTSWLAEAYPTTRMTSTHKLFLHNIMLQRTLDMFGFTLKLNRCPSLATVA